MAISENTANTSILISLESINQQIQHCENIVDNIDKLVPNLYKIRQQALAQKNYITDIQHTLSNNNKQYKSVQESTVKIYTKTEGSADTPGFTSNDNIPTVLLVSIPSTDVTDDDENDIIGTSIKYKNKSNIAITKNKIDRIDKLRDVIQSLYKFKHDQGTSVHFTAQQIDTSGDSRKKGLNLADVESITEGLNDYLSISDTDVAGTNNTNAETKIKNTVLKLFAPVDNTAAATLTNSSIEDSNKIDLSKLSEFKAPITKANEGDKTKELTSDRDIKAKRIEFKGGLGPVALDYQNIITFGLN